MMEEKRKKTRVRVNAIISYKVKTTRLVGGSRIKDISETGICIPSKHHFTIDSIVELEIRSDELNESITTLARVARITHRNKSKFPFEVGLEFVDFPLTKQRIFQEYISRCIAQGVNQDISWIG